MHSPVLHASFGAVGQVDAVATRTFRLVSVSICILAALSFFFLPLPTLQWFSDYWEHASALRVLSESPWAPTNPHYATSDPDRQFIPLFVLLGWLMHFTGISVTTALAIAGTLTTALFCIGVGMFARAYFRRPWAPVALIAVLLCAWGNPWVWTGFYELRAIFHTDFYPASFVFSLTFITWALLIRVLRRNVLLLSDYIALPGLMALMFVSHQLGGLFAFGGAALFLLFEPYGSVRTRLILFGCLMAGLGVTCWWPYFNPIELTYHGSGDKENEGIPQFYSFFQVLLLIGPAWIGLPIIYDMAKRRVHLALVFGFLGLFIAYLGGGMIGHPVAHRFLSYMVVFLHLPIVWKILSIKPGRFMTFPRLYIVAAVLVISQTGLSAVDFVRVAYERQTGHSFGKYPSYNILSELTEATRDMPRDAVMFASADPALSVTALKGKVVARPRPQLMIQNGALRNQDNARFFSKAASESERRSLIRKYGAGFILIRPENVPPDVVVELERLGKVTYAKGQLTLIRIDQSKTS